MCKLWLRDLWNTGEQTECAAWHHRKMFVWHSGFGTIRYVLYLNISECWSEQQSTRQHTASSSSRPTVVMPVCRQPEAATYILLKIHQPSSTLAPQLHRQFIVLCLHFAFLSSSFLENLNATRCPVQNSLTLKNLSLGSQTENSAG